MSHVESLSVNLDLPSRCPHRPALRVPCPVQTNRLRRGLPCALLRSDFRVGKEVALAALAAPRPRQARVLTKVTVPLRRLSTTRVAQLAPAPRAGNLVAPLRLLNLHPAPRAGADRGRRDGLVNKGGERVDRVHGRDGAKAFSAKTQTKKKKKKRVLDGLPRVVSLADTGASLAIDRHPLRIRHAELTTLVSPDVMCLIGWFKYRN